MKKEWELITLKDEEYSFEMLAAEDALRVSLCAVDAFGGIIASMIPLLKEDSGEIDIFNIDYNALNISAVHATALEALKFVDPAKIKPVFDALISTIFSVKENRRCTYDDFNGNMLTLYKLMFFAIRYNFADFFGASVND